MKTIMQPVDMITITNRDGYMHPYKFKYPDFEYPIFINSIEFCDETKHAGSRVLIYRCRSNIDGAERTYELKYDINLCKWYLFRM